MDSKREAYPFAGALCVAAGNVLAAVHHVAGPPPADGAEEMSEEDRQMAAAAGVAYGAAAACAGLSARLLPIEREAVRERVPEIGVPKRFELGITSLEATDMRSWRATVRAAAAARTELDACLEHWSSRTGGSQVTELLHQLIEYVDELTGVLERIEPDEPT